MMRTALMLATIALLAAAAVPPSLFRNEAPALEIDTWIQPVTMDSYLLLRRVQPGMYRCRSLVHIKPGSRKVFGTDSIVLKPGESGEKKQDVGPFTVTFEATLSKTLEAKTVVTVTRDGQVINRQTSTIALPRGKT
jgi:hypothetical protein